MFCQRFSICQLCAAPLEIAAITLSMSRPARWPRFSASDEALDEAGDAHLVHHLGDLARARRADQGDRLGVGHGDRVGLVERPLLAAAHHGELAVLGARLAARHRRVDEVDAVLLALRMELARDVGRGGGVVVEDRALAHAGEGAVVAQHDRAQVVVVADAAEHDLLALARPPCGVLAALPLCFLVQASALAKVRL